MYSVSPPVIVLQRVGKRSELSQRALKEQKIVNQRIKDCGESFQTIPKLLDSVFHTTLTFTDYKNIAEELTRFIPIKIDRLSKRNKSAMICWFAENWSIVNCFLPHIAIDAKPEEKDEPKMQEFTVPTKHSGAPRIIFPTLCPVF